MKKPFKYRSAQGVWINDTRNSPIFEEWPGDILDDETEDELYKCFDLIQKAGFNTFNVFGLFATYAWKLDIYSTVPDERMTRVERIIGETHKRGIKIILGIGLYSWGFDEIMANRQICMEYPEGRRLYKIELEKMLAELDEIDGHVADGEKLRRIKICIENVIRDIDSFE